MLKKVCRPEMDEVTGGWRGRHNEELYGSVPHQILFGLSKQGDWDGQGM